MDWLQKLLKIVRDDYLKDSYRFEMVDGGLNLSYEVSQLENIVDVIKKKMKNVDKSKNMKQQPLYQESAQIQKLQETIDQQAQTIKKINEKLDIFKFQQSQFRSKSLYLIILQIKTNFIFESIPNMLKNIHFFDEKLYIKQQKNNNISQMSLLSQFQKNMFDQNTNENTSGLQTQIVNEQKDQFLIKSQEFFQKRFDQVLEQKIQLIGT